MELLKNLQNHSLYSQVDSHEEERCLVFPIEKRIQVVDEELLDKIFKEAIQLRDKFREKEKKIIENGTDHQHLSCTNLECNEFTTMVTNRDGDYTCSRCGLVKYSRMPDGQIEFVGLSYRMHNRYDPMSHYGEKIAQACGSTPNIPLDLLVPIDEEYYRGDYPRNKETLSRDAIAKILANVKVPRYLQIKYQSERYKKTLCQDLHRQKYFSERWIYLRYHWLGAIAPIMLPVLIERLRFMFALFTTTFNSSRHNKTCTRSQDCHKRGKQSCNHNMPPYYFTTGHIFRVIMRSEKIQNYARPIIYKQKVGEPCADLFQMYMPYMPCLRLGTYIKYNQMVEDAFKMLGWSHSFIAITFETPYTHEWTFGLRPK